MELVDNSKRLISTGNMKVVLTATAMVAEPIALAVTSVAVESAARIGRGGEENQVVVLVGGVGDQLGILGTTQMEEKVARNAEIHGLS